MLSTLLSSSLFSWYLFVVDVFLVVVRLFFYCSFIVVVVAVVVVLCSRFIYVVVFVVVFPRVMSVNDNTKYSMQ